MKIIINKKILLFSYNFFFAVLIFSLFTVSCKKDWLDVKADKQQAVPSTLKDFQSMLDESFFFNSFEPLALGEISSDGHYIIESTWPLIYFDFERNAYTWTKERPFVKAYEWDNVYARILHCNIILDGLKKITPNNNIDQLVWNNIKGQALFHRAMSFYSLAQIWAPPYNAATANNDLGIPLRVTSDITVVSKRSTVEQTYNQIIQDASEAIALLQVTNPTIPLDKTRASKPAAYALLSRVFLTMEDYGKAEQNANACLNLYGKLLDYSTLSTTGNFIGRFNDEVIFHTTFFSGEYYTIGANCLLDTALRMLYHSNDIRRTRYFRPNADGTFSFRGTYNNSRLLPFAGLATDEIYLIRAECFARNGNIASAMKDLNNLLRTRWTKVGGTSTYVEQTADNEDDALKKILTERKKELLLRGLRWIDMRRLNKDDRFKFTLKRTINGQVYTLEPNSYKYTFPIPDNILGFTSIPQNLGW